MSCDFLSYCDHSTPKWMGTPEYKQVRRKSWNKGSENSDLTRWDQSQDLLLRPGKAGQTRMGLQLQPTIRSLETIAEGVCLPELSDGPLVHSHLCPCNLGMGLNSVNCS